MKNKLFVIWNIIQFLIFLVFIRFLGIGIIYLGNLMK